MTNCTACIDCKVSVVRKSRDHNTVRCEPCRIAYKRERQAEWQREHYRAGKGRRHHLVSTYGITDSDVDSMLSKQGGVCAICKTASPGGEWL